jgi:hypothetical protein
MLTKFWKCHERSRCACCGEWIEPGFDDRTWNGDETYHWQCYWRIVWPQKAKNDEPKKAHAK